MVVTAVQEASLRGQIAAHGTAARAAASADRDGAASSERSAPRASWTCSPRSRRRRRSAQTLPPLQKQLGQTRDALTALLGRLPAEEPRRDVRARGPDAARGAAGERALEAGRAAARRAPGRGEPARRIRRGGRGDRRHAAAIRDQRRYRLERAEAGRAVLAVHGILGRRRLADPDPVRCRGAACTRSALPTRRSIRRRRNIAPRSFSPARMWPTRCARCRRTPMRCKPSAEARARGHGARFELAQRQHAARHDQLWWRCSNAEQAVSAGGIGVGRRRRRTAMPTPPACFKRSAAAGGIDGGASL